MARGPSLIPQRVKNTGLDLTIAALLFGGGVLAVGYLNKRFGILNKFVSGVGTLGFKVGEATAVGLGSIPTGLATGAKNFSVASGGTGQIGSTWDIAVQNLKDNLGIGGNPTNSINPNAYGEQQGNNQQQGGFAELITAIEKNPQATAQLGEANTRNLTSGRTFKTFQDLFKDIQPATSTSATTTKPLNVAAIIKQAGQRLTQAQVQASNAKTPSRNKGFGGYGTAETQESTLQALIAANMKRYPQFFKVV